MFTWVCSNYWEFRKPARMREIGGLLYNIFLYLYKNMIKIVYLLIFCHHYYNFNSLSFELSGFRIKDFRIFYLDMYDKEDIHHRPC